MTRHSHNEFIKGPSGALEIRLAKPKHSKPEKYAWVVLCHPHPQFGGTMDNKVITTLEKTFHQQGYGTVAFNFRGVGKSEGQYDAGEGEQQDLMAVVEYLRSQFSLEKLILAGFSFGGFIAAKTQAALKADQLCLVAPAVSLYDFSDIRIEVPWVLIQGGEDEVIAGQEVLDWAWTQPLSPDVYWRSQASHFFHRQLIWLKHVVALSY